jgi:Domain of unknown function (DUF4041)/T5orf172 domain
MAVLDVFRVNKIKAELELVQKERDQIKSTLAETEHMDHFELKRAIADLQEQKGKLEREVQNLGSAYTQTQRDLERNIGDLKNQVDVRKREIVILDDEILLQSFGFYKPRYELQNSDAYRVKLEQIRKQQEDMIKGGKATISPTNWTVNNSLKEGEKMVKYYVKLILRSFNNECDASIINVKFNNVESIEKKIRKAYDVLNALGKRINISIELGYLNLKLQELYLCYEYQIKKQQEKEEQKRIREQMREEAKLIKEIEDRKLKIAKEEKHFVNALTSLNAQMLRATSAAEKELLVREQASIQQRLVELGKDMTDVLNREQNTRAGNVYIISNIGSFGENIYKIGVTRRLEPQERIDELGDASVPFDFDIHAVIFSDDAPALENALHKAFEHRRLNMINRRREFFHVTLEEIEYVVKNSFSKPVEFVVLADATEYRQSALLRQERGG